MHMPGHKRNTEVLNMINPYEIDITEIEGFDNLHHREGILKEGTNRAACLYGSEYTNYLIGSSTAGILSGIAACTKKGDKIIIARNCHKAVYHAIYLNELQPIYIYPDLIKKYEINGGISPEKIEELLIKHKDIKLIVLTSPTYEGIISNIKEISKMAHKYSTILMVDEAHGAHLGFHPGWPVSSIKAGADIVIHSLHKTLPALTQTGLIHVNGNLADKDEITRYLGIYQSSSPSYILMSSIEQCITILEEKREELFCDFYDRLQHFYLRMKNLKHLKLLTKEEVESTGFDFDPSKLTITVKNASITAKELYLTLLEKYKIQMEMVSKDYVLGMTSICDKPEGFLRLEEALLEIDDEVKYNKEDENSPFGHRDNYLIEDLVYPVSQPEMVMPSHKAYEAVKDRIPVNESAGRVTTEYVYLYPPGIPLLVPGERISEDMVSYLQRIKESGLFLQGMKDINSEYIEAVAE